MARYTRASHETNRTCAATPRHHGGEPDRVGRRPWCASVKPGLADVCASIGRVSTVGPMRWWVGLFRLGLWLWAGERKDHELDPGADERFVVHLGWDAEDIA